VWKLQTRVVREDGRGEGCVSAAFASGCDVMEGEKEDEWRWEGGWWLRGNVRACR